MLGYFFVYMSYCLFAVFHLPSLSANVHGCFVLCLRRSARGVPVCPFLHVHPSLHALSAALGLAQDHRAVKSKRIDSVCAEAIRVSR